MSLLEITVRTGKGNVVRTIFRLDFFSAIFFFKLNMTSGETVHLTGIIQFFDMALLFGTYHPAFFSLDCSYNLAAIVNTRWQLALSWTCHLVPLFTGLQVP